MTLNGHRHAHWTRNVKTKDHRDILAAHLLIFDLGNCLNQVANNFVLWNFLVIESDLVSRITELTSPNLILSFHSDFAFTVKDSLASLAYFRITRRQFNVILEASKLYLEDISVDFNVVLICFFTFFFADLFVYTLDLFSFTRVVLLITQV